MVGTSAYVNIWVGGERKEAIAIPTDSNGVARLQLTLNPNDVNVPDSTGHGTIVANHPVCAIRRVLPNQCSLCGVWVRRWRPLSARNEELQYERSS